MSRISAIRPSAWLATLAFIAMALPMSAAVAPPTITDFNPKQCYEGQYGSKFRVNITGTNFNWVSAVSVGGRSASFVVNDSKNITAYVPVSASSNPIYVTTAGGTAYGKVPFYVLPIPRPTITDFNPKEAYVGECGKTIVITGTGFQGIPGTNPSSGAKSVSIGGHSTTNFSVLSDTIITVVIPPGATTYGLSVTNAGGTGYSADYLTILPIPAPVITSFSPEEIDVGDTTTKIQIHGDNFLGIGVRSKVKTGVTSVSVGGKSPLIPKVLSDDLLEVVVPAGATTNLISVTSSGGTTYSTKHLVVNAIPLPTVDSFTPGEAIVGDDKIEIIVTGTGFNGKGTVGGLPTGVSHVYIGGVETFSWKRTSGDDNHLTLTVPAGAASGSISVTTAGGTGYSSDAFIIRPITAPTISTYTPEGRVGTDVVIHGTNFIVYKNNGTDRLTTLPIVTIGGRPAAIKGSYDANSITATVDAQATTGGISVQTEGGTAYSSGYFTVLTVPAPTITSLSTGYGYWGDWIHIFGTNLDQEPVSIKFGNTTVGAGYIVSPFDICVQIPDYAASGLITVTTPGGTATSAGDFEIAAAPDILEVNPWNGLVGDTITLSGTNFTDAYSVEFGVVPAFFDVLDASHISAIVPTGGNGKITVRTPYGFHTTDGSFIVNPSGAAPTISSFLCQGTDEGGIGEVVTITGTNFTAGSKVMFNGVAAVTVVDNSTSIRATIPASATTGLISVSTSGGMAFSNKLFYVIQAPTITSSTPSVKEYGIVEIWGTNFTNGTKVTFGAGVPADSIVIWSCNYITVTMPHASPGPYDMKLTTRGGSSTGSVTVIP